MALFKGSIAGTVSGSVGSLTFSHNKGGAYIRNRAIPVNPNTVYQQAVRAHMTSLSNRWLSTLTAAQRSGWETYAQQVPIPNAFGDPGTIPAMSHYVRSNAPRLQAGLARVDDAPILYNIGEFTSPTFAVDALTDQVDVSFDNSDDWAGEVGSSMLIYASRQYNQTINYFKGPYRIAGKVDGAATPPTSPATVTLPFPVDAGNRIFFRVGVSRSDGRYNGSFRGFGDAS